MHALNNQLGAVVIGRNEGERLRRCLESVTNQFRRVVYVDSGSTDGSTELAKTLGADVVALEPQIAFTAARARNRGWQRLLELDPDIEFVQFIDGDCSLHETWGSQAASAFESHPDAAAVSGRLRELYPDQNLYHRLAAMEWERPSGPGVACGGVAMYRAEALRDSGGFRESLVAGEEPELCWRLQKSGWTIWHISAEMATHDIGMTSFRQWWRRAARAGYAYTEAMALHSTWQKPHNLKRVCSVWFWALLPFVAVLLAGPTNGWSFAILIGFYAIVTLRIARSRIQKHSNSLSDSCLYAAACLVAKWPQAIGSFRCLNNVISRKN